MDTYTAPGRYYRFRQPHSSVIASECTREWFRRQVDGGFFPKQSIWIPGSCVGAGSRPDIGDVFAPDPKWKPAVSLASPSEPYSR